MIFEATSAPRVFALPPGVDFGRAFLDELLNRCSPLSPEAFARVDIYVNTRRMQRRLREILDQGPTRLLPRIRIVTDLANDVAGPDIPPAVSPLRRRLELSQLVGHLLDKQPDLAPRSALFDLSDGLARLMDEMNGEGLGPDAFNKVQTAELSEYWLRSMRFLGLVSDYLGHMDGPPDAEARQRRVIEDLARRWEVSPPDHPVIVAGSTGSRGATLLFMQAVARLPQGCVILPGFDFDLPEPVWNAMADRMSGEDHPQYRFRNLMAQMGLKREDIRPWTETFGPAAPARNRVISLSLRPAPVTDQWREEGPHLGDLRVAMEGVTLIEAPNPRSEAETIALRLRAAIDAGETAALISPDRTLTRQVAAALDRWAVVPDDSAGQPLPLSPPGRFLRLVVGLFGQRCNGEMLLSLLKHPLCHSAQDRGPHLRRAHELELELRRNGPPFPDKAMLLDWANKTGENDPGRQAWAGWISDLSEGLAMMPDAPLAELVALHVSRAEGFAAGPSDQGSGGLWDEAAGRQAKSVMAELALHADAGGVLSAADYAALFGTVLAGSEVRNPDRGHPQIRIWGTLEARVQGADLVILAGMNEGVWPEAVAADPWLNRQMRADMGLPLPERRIGLSAHDYQQAVAGPKVWISRAIRSEEAETVASRWVYRLTNLLEGLPDQGGRDALAAMRAEGQRWIDQAASLSARDSDTQRAHRPSPRPPVAARPKELSVTQIEKLMRDPYEIYVRKVLGIEALNPLVPEPGGAMRGNILHTILERVIKEGVDPASPGAKDRLLEIANEELGSGCPWPTIRRMWFAHVTKIADWFLETEVSRQATATPTCFEAWGSIDLDGLAFRIKGKADRIDLTPTGSAILYDYKSGSLPSAKSQLYFDKQLLIEAAMLEKGAFGQLGPRTAEACYYVGVGSTNKDVAAPLDKAPVDQVWDGLHKLVRVWSDRTRGYSAKLALEKTDFSSPYDDLARFGEWDLSSPATPEDVG